MARLTHPWLLYLLVYGVRCVGNPYELPLCWFATGVQKVAHGMFDTTFGLGIGWQMVLHSVH
jgi:hypothetical protein